MNHSACVVVVAFACSESSTTSVVVPDDLAAVDSMAGLDVSEPDAGSADVPDVAPEADVVALPLPCNGAAELCGRRFDEVCFPMTHNSMSNADAEWIAPNQTHGITRQLKDGIRGLMLDVHPFEGQTWLCHGYCEIGKQLLTDGLGELRDFLAENPREIVSIIFEPHVPAPEVVAGVIAAGLESLVYTHPGGEWPTLEAMIAADTRLVLFTESDGGDPPWYHSAWTWISDTNYSAKVPSDLTCDLNRGDASNELFLINNFMGNPLPGADLAAQVNVSPFLADRATACAAAREHLPNFIGVDFYEIGDLFEVVRAVNGLP